MEASRLKLIQMEQDLERARKQGLCVGGGSDASDHLGLSAAVNSGVTTFEIEYGHWVEEQNRQTCDLRNALNAHIGDTELQMLVTDGLSHYFQLFRIKATATKADVFYVMSGMWKTSAERFFLWVGGYRPSELLKVLVPQIDPMTEHQVFEVLNLKQSCEQAEDALTQGMEKLQETLAKTVAASQLVEETYIPQMGTAVEKLEALVDFVSENISSSTFIWQSKDFIKKKKIYADHIRQETLHQIARILTTRQAARGLLALGEYFQRLRVLSSVWATRSREPF
ncbi:transcription factor TGA1-like isoform X2 [Corylus avellana]|uniref:transcription factor TGA1-like isoform X2 n=1 Tax=Corylus avellana TaxID=13451 RepID=UPI00286C0840|nr:transcription factor TGA1-like isoform X2 [Corylus avellana]